MPRFTRAFESSIILDDLGSGNGGGSIELPQHNSYPSIIQSICVFHDTSKIPPIFSDRGIELLDHLDGLYFINYNRSDDRNKANRNIQKMAGAAQG